MSLLAKVANCHGSAMSVELDTLPKNMPQETVEGYRILQFSPKLFNADNSFASFVNVKQNYTLLGR